MCLGRIENWNLEKCHFKIKVTLLINIPVEILVIFLFFHFYVWHIIINLPHMPVFLKSLFCFIWKAHTYLYTHTRERERERDRVERSGARVELGQSQKPETQWEQSTWIMETLGLESSSLSSRVCINRKAGSKVEPPLEPRLSDRGSGHVKQLLKHSAKCVFHEWMIL